MDENVDAIIGYRKGVRGHCVKLYERIFRKLHPAYRQIHREYVLVHTSDEQWARHALWLITLLTHWDQQLHALKLEAHLYSEHGYFQHNGKQYRHSIRFSLLRHAADTELLKHASCRFCGTLIYDALELDEIGHNPLACLRNPEHPLYMGAGQTHCCTCAHQLSAYALEMNCCDVCGWDEPRTLVLQRLKY